MRSLIYLAIIFSISGCTKEMKPEPTPIVKKVSFQQVWDQVTSDKLEKLPQNQVSFSKLYKKSKDIISMDATRTLENYNDILEPFDKLAHPNGICFKGIWSIDTQNIYTGYFKKGSEALLIARASTALSNTISEDNRAFGFSGKLFPTLNPIKINDEYSANFFLIDDLGGTDAKYYRDVELTNEPKASLSLTVLKNILYAIKVAYSFEKADSHSGIRQLYEISNLGEVGKEDIVTPKWMKIKAISNTKNKKDFRDELMLNDNETLVFEISVANTQKDDKKDWQRIGTITLDSSVVSNSCDHRLHFHHPKYQE